MAKSRNKLRMKEWLKTMALVVTAALFPIFEGEGPSGVRGINNRGGVSVRPINQRQREVHSEEAQELRVQPASAIPTLYIYPSMSTAVL